MQNSVVPFHGRIFVFTAPSGAGKTTIVKHLLTHFPNTLAFSVSATSRTPRPGEQDGIDYHFMSIDEFKTRADKDAFLEWEEVYEGQYYGTLHDEIQRIWNAERHIIFDVDVKGAVNIKKHFGNRCLSIFIKPPSLQVLVDRLKHRNTETPASLKKRVARIREELTYENRFDRVLVNDILEVALKEAELMVEEFVLKSILDLDGNLNN
jgi:guanylate kinase